MAVIIAACNECMRLRMNTNRSFLAVLLCLSAGLLLVACTLKAADPVAPMTRYVLEHGGLEREYFVFLPSSYDAKAELPVAIFMHGYGGTATGTEVEVAQGLNFYAEKYGYVMVYPQGTWFMSGDTPETQWEVTSWNYISDGFDVGPDGPICSSDVRSSPCPPECGTCGQCGWTSCHDDIGFLKSLVASVSTEFVIAQDSFFVSGFSNGAMMANRIACEASELFAGAALVGGRVERGFECTPTTRLPLLQMNGGKDYTVPHDGSESTGKYFYASTTAIAEHWNDGNACAVEREAWLSPTIAGTDAACTISCGDSNDPAIDCIWAEGNHRWPGTPDFRGSNGHCVSELQAASMPDQLICIDADYSIDKWGSRLMFEFFDEHRSPR
jgi:polyhydroxybutyrate depolymerase